MDAEDWAGEEATTAGDADLATDTEGDARPLDKLRATGDAVETELVAAIGDLTEGLKDLERVAGEARGPPDATGLPTAKLAPTSWCW